MKEPKLIYNPAVFKREKKKKIIFESDVGDLVYNPAVFQIKKTKKSDVAAKIMTDDEKRLLKLGYVQELKRIFGSFTNFGLTSSMISILLGIIPLYTFELESGG